MNQHQAVELPSHAFLSQLARDDSEAFEALRSALIENCIQRASARLQPRLRQLQFRVDGIRWRSRSSLGCAARVHAMMWQSFLQLDHELQNLVGLARGSGDQPGASPQVAKLPSASARIIDFKPRPPTPTTTPGPPEPHLQESGSS